jgi:hypothetical protein
MQCPKPRPPEQRCCVSVPNIRREEPPLAAVAGGRLSGGDAKMRRAMLRNFFATLPSRAAARRFDLARAHVPGFCSQFTSQEVPRANGRVREKTHYKEITNSTNSLNFFLKHRHQKKKPSINKPPPVSRAHQTIPHSLLSQLCHADASSAWRICS